MPLHFQAWHETFAEYGVKCSHDFLESQAGIPAKQILENVNKKFSWDLPIQEFSSKKRKKSLQLIPEAKAIKPICDIALHYHQKLPQAVASGGSKESVHLILKNIKLFDYFDEVITSDDPVSPKPSPDIFLEASRRLNVSPENCIVFEDGEPGIVAAKKAGMHVFDVRLHL